MYNKAKLFLHKAKRKAIRFLKKNRLLFVFIDYLKINKYYKVYSQYLKFAEKSKDFSIEVINLNATDICNSGCTMCNIWKQKRETEFTSTQLTEILTNELFTNLKHVGITGGEPTLRIDLPELFEAVIKAQPNIVGLSTITNCIRENDVIERVDASIEICRKHEKDFSMMISLDGVGEVHDSVRGKKGNFESAIRVYNYFKNKNIPIATGTTISKINVWDVDDMLLFLKDNNIYGRFRVAEFIKRLYNDDRSDVIRNFDEDETYHLILFFYKLIYTFEKSSEFKNTYYSIINVLSGGKRLIQCPYHKNGIVLNSKGEIAYCAPKSKVIGNALNTSAYQLYISNTDELKLIQKEYCDSCIHDYHAPIINEEYKNKKIRTFWQEYIKLESQIPFEFHKKIIHSKKTTGKYILITGWYGTETVGDKAILAQIIIELKQKYADKYKIIVASLYPLITLRTRSELKQNFEVIDAYSEEFIVYSKISEIVIMGGGPLMDLDELALPLTAFKLAKHSGHKTILYGCGVGPLFVEKYIVAVKQLLSLADIIMLRDKQSVELAGTWHRTKNDILLSGDPAKKYISQLKKENVNKDKKILSCYLRELTYEYFRDKSEQDFVLLKNSFEQGLADYIYFKAKELCVDEIRFEHMHNFVIGNDDRDFSRYFIKNYFRDSEIQISYNQKLSTVENIVESMQQSEHNICMRFHSVLFAETLATNFTAIDYTSGGKIYNYLFDCDKLNSLVTVKELIG